MSKRIVTVFGGSGFLGRHVISKLAREGAMIRVAVRRPELAGYLCPMGSVGQISLIQANVRDDASVARAVEGATDVINLAGILSERGRQRFAEVHANAPGRIGRAAAKAGVTRMIHVSALGATADASSAYARSKAAGEIVLREAFPNASILRPGVMFGTEDNFFNKFGALARISPVLPLFCAIRQKPKLHLEGLYLVPEIEAGTTRMQPVFVEDVAEAMARIIGQTGNESAGKTYELGGPNIYNFRQLMEFVAKETQYKRLLVPVPYFVADMIGFFAQFMPEPIFTADQAKMLRDDNLVGEGTLTLSDLGISASPAELILPTYMHRFRRARANSSTAAQA